MLFRSGRDRRASRPAEWLFAGVIRPSIAPNARAVHGDSPKPRKLGKRLVSPSDSAAALDNLANCPKLEQVRSRPVSAVLLAWLLVASGTCLCLAGVPAQPSPDSHDCGSEPAVPASDDGAPCESGCTVDEVVRPPAGERAVDQAPSCAGALLGEASTEPALGPACSHASRDMSAGPLQSAPAYLLHSALLL